MKFDRDKMILYLENQLEFDDGVLTRCIAQKSLEEALSVQKEMDAIEWFIEILNDPEHYGCNAMEE